MSKDTEPAAAMQRAQQANSAAANSLSNAVGEIVTKYLIDGVAHPDPRNIETLLEGR